MKIHFLVIAVDTSFSLLDSILDDIGVIDLGGSNAYMVLLICAYPLEDCIKDQTLRNSIASGGFAVITPYSSEWAQIRQNVYPKVMTGQQSTVIWKNYFQSVLSKVFQNVELAKILSTNCHSDQMSF